ncbi:MAG: sulfatase-like hydrolase/transferase [Bacteroidales bacterium]|nr:sulfatase-like hydrolase/transferase [Bacteroidales bacterium]
MFRPLISISRSHTDVFKGLGILFIVFHNYFHWVWPSPGENEFNFSTSRILTLWEQIFTSPLEIFNLLFSYFGHFGVQIFIFISGYGLAMAANAKGVKYFSFLIRRFGKIYPSFLMAVAVLIVLRIFSAPESLNGVFFHQIKLKLLLIANFFPGEALTINGPWWFYSMIFQLYVVFPLLWWLDKKSTGISFFLISALALGLIFVLGVDPWQSKTNLMQNMPGHLPEFLLGIYIANRKPGKFASYLWPLALLIFALGNYFESLWLLTFISVTWLLVVFFQRLADNLKPGSVFLRIIVYFGSISMYLFAIHGFIRVPFVEMASKDFIPLKSILLFIPFIIISTLLAHGMMLFEKWVRSYIPIPSYQKVKASIRSLFFRLGHEPENPAMSFFAYWWLILLGMLIFNRIAEYVLLVSGNVPGGVSTLTMMSLGLFFDIKLWLVLAVLIYIPYRLLGLWLNKTARILLVVVVVLTVVLNIFLMKYFTYTLAPLDQVIYSYSWENIIGTLTSSGGFTWVMWIPVIVLLSLFVILIRIFPKIHITRIMARLIFICALGIYFLGIQVTPDINKYNDDLTYSITTNKAAFFVGKSVDYLFLKNKSDLDSESRISEYATDFQLAFPEKQYMSKRFPFLHYNTAYPDVLSPFFEESDRKPNIVFLVIESLGSAYSGPNAYLGSFTPFIDSLATHSLYWENFLSTSQRTFEVMPSLLGSLPYGSTGFMNYNTSIPDHRTIISILKENGYNTSFFYGGNPDFDQMWSFFKMNNTDFVMVNRDTTLTTVTENELGSWGYPDHELYKRVLNTLDSIENDSVPNLEVVLSLSMHLPFNIPFRDKYISIVDKMLKQGKIPEHEKDLVRKNKKAFASILYGDASIREFFKGYRKRKDFDNTIFIITGDHHIGVFGDRDHLDKYRVPLLIYSPMLKKAVSFKSISSHLDVSPSILAFLNNKHGVQLPPRASWLGIGLDTTRSFQMNRSLPFILNSREIIEYADRGYYYTRGRLYKIKEGLELESVNNDAQKDLISKRLESFITLSSYVSQFNRLISGKNFGENSGLQVLLSENNDFERPDPESLFANTLDSSEAYSGTHSINMNGDAEYGSLMKSIELTDEYSALYAEIKCRIKPNTADQTTMPILVFDLLNTEGKSVHWQSFPILKMDGTSYNVNEWQDFYINVRQDLLQWDQKAGFMVKMYFWNYKKTGFYYDDLNVKIQVEK